MSERQSSRRTVGEERAKLLTAVKQHTSEHGRTPSHRDVQEANPSLRSRVLFSNWDDVTDAAGVPPITNDEMIDDLRRTVTSRDHPTAQNPGPPAECRFSRRLFEQRFGSMTAAFDAAGFDTSGFVYVIRYSDGDPDHVKIGKSVTPYGRLNAISDDVGKELEMCIAVKHPRALDAENKLHQEYSHRCVADDPGHWGHRSEWFELIDDELDELIDRLRGWARTFGTDVIEGPVVLQRRYRG